MPAVLGYVLVVVGLLLGVGGLLKFMKAKKLLAAPFKKTGEIGTLGQSPDPKGLISTEGNVVVQQPIQAPCSGQPCIYYEIEVTRLWEKSELTENGTKTSKGSTKVFSQEVGGVFYLDDGSGPATIDAREKAAADDAGKDLVQSFEQVQNAAAGDVYFGQFRASIPYDSNVVTTGIKCVERVMSPDGTAFVIGRLNQGAITPQDGMLGKITISRRGREALVGGAKKMATILFAAAGVFALPGIVISITGEASAPSVDACALTNETADKACTGRISSNAGDTKTWTVTQPGKYAITVRGTGKSSTWKLWPEVDVTMGAQKVAHKSSTETLTTTACVSAGTYSIAIKDTSDASSKVKGGQGYELTIKKAADDSAMCDGEDLRPAAAAASAPALASAAVTATATVKAPAATPAKLPTPKAAPAKATAPAKKH